jgi:hypothetical protein
MPYVNPPGAVLRIVFDDGAVTEHEFDGGVDYYAGAFGGEWRARQYEKRAVFRHPSGVDVPACRVVSFKITEIAPVCSKCGREPK